jgi:hypothetical protein
MLLQSLLAIAIMLLLAGALLTNALVSAKVAMHQAATRHVSIALARGTDDFTRWAANFVYTNRAGAQWPTNVQTTSPEPICDGSATRMQTEQRTTCTLFETTTYQVTGSTTAPSPKGDAATAGQSTAENLQTLVDEQRISAEVTATITNASGVVIGSVTRELTARVFDAPPYAIVTGTRDASTVLGSEHAAEGDTSGIYAIGKSSGGNATPDPANPSSYKVTVIRVKMTCTNSSANNDQTDPVADNKPPGNNNMPWGVQAVHRAFEAPCLPSYGILNVPSDAEIPADANYDVSSFADPKPWRNGSSDAASGWAQ